MSSSPLLGRNRELELGQSALDRDVDAPRAVAYVGGPGIGRSALLDELAGRAHEAGAVVLRAGGSPLESGFPFAALSQLLRPTLADAAAQLSARHNRILDRVARIGAPAAGAHPETGMAVLALVELLSRDGLLVVVVDDADLLDKPSADIIRFVARRAAGLSVVLFTAGQDRSAAVTPDAVVAELAPLTTEDARTLLGRHAQGLDAGQREAVLQTAQGNPLAVIELAHALRANPLGGHAPGQLPVTARIRESFAARFDQLPAPTRRLLLLAVCLQSGELAEVAAAAAAARIDLRALDEAEENGLVQVDGQAVRFPHPVIASVIAAAARPAELREAHRLLAESLAGHPARALWHRAAAATTADENLAAALEEAARTLPAPRDAATVAVSLERAAVLSTDGRARARRLAAAADATRAAGRYAAAETLLARIDLTAADPQTRLSVDAQRAWHEFDTGSVDAALTLLVGVLEQAVPIERSQAIRAAALAGLARWLAGNHTFDPALRSFTSRLAADSSSSDSPLMLMALTAADASDAAHRVLRLLADAAGQNGADGPSTADPTPNADTRAWELARLADTALMIDAIEPARTLARRASEQLRTSGSFGALTTALSTWCHAEFSAGNWDATARLGREVLDLAAVTGQQRQAAFVKANLAFLAAAQDRPGEAQRLRGEVLTWATPRQHRLIAALASWSQLLGALGDGEVDLALEAARAMQSPSSAGTPAPAGSLLIASACADVVEALGRADRHDGASAVIGWVEDRLRRWPSPTLAGHAAHARAVSTELSGADRADVEAGYERAIAAAAPTGTFAHARVRLAYGAWLRRTRQARRSRAHLTIAEELFAGLGATAWQRRADAELRAAGQVAPEREADPTEIAVEDGRDQLTAQEQLIVELAAEGLSNRQIGERLYLSPRTVGSHLYKAFPKLGVSNRTQLRTALQARKSSDRTG